MTTPLDLIKSAILGNPLNPAKKPERAGVIKAFAAMQTQLEASQSGAIVRGSRIDLPGAAPVYVMAWVTNDADPAKNGIYSNTGSATATIWTRITDIPQFVISGINEGAGTFNAIQIETDLPVPSEDGRCMVIIPIVGANTASPVTVAINGGSPLPIVSNTGVNIAIGGVQAGMYVCGFIADGKFRLLSDQNVAAIVAEVEGYYNDTFDLVQKFIFAPSSPTTRTNGDPLENGDLWVNETTGSIKVWNGLVWTGPTDISAEHYTYEAVGNGVLTTFSGLHASANNGNTDVFVGPQLQHVAAFNISAGSIVFTAPPPDGVPVIAKTTETVPFGSTGAALVSVVDSDGYYTATDVEGVLKEIGAALEDVADGGQLVMPSMYGAVGDNVTDDTTALQAMFNAVTTGQIIYLGGKTYLFSALTILTKCTIMNGKLRSSKTSNGVCITIGKTARPTFISVDIQGAGSKTTVQLYYLLDQRGTSRTDRAAGFIMRDCALSGAGYGAITNKWSTDIILERVSVSNCAYCAIEFLSPLRTRVKDCFVDMRGAVGSSANAYGIALTYDSAGFHLDPNAGFPSANNHFPIDSIVDGCTFYGPEIWEGIDHHGAYGFSIINNHIYGVKHGIMAGNGSGDATPYAGFKNIIANNYVTTRDYLGENAGVTAGYGITVQGGGSTEQQNSREWIVTGNIVQGFGSAAPDTNSVSILINNYANLGVVTSNILRDWTGYGIFINLASSNLVINDNVFDRMAFASGNDSSCVYFQSDFAGRAVVMGNVLYAGAYQPYYGCRNRGTGTVSYASDFRGAANTEYSDASGNGRSAW